MHDRVDQPRKELIAVHQKFDAPTLAVMAQGTVEFLLDPSGKFYFLEMNTRIQVEHAVTEQVTGVDLVRLQLQLADGMELRDLGLQQADIPAPRGHAIQVRINMETLGDDGSVKPAGGTLRVFDVPSGPGIRTDTFGYQGYTVSPRYDSLLAKLIGHSTSAEFADAVHRTHHASQMAVSPS